MHPDMRYDLCSLASDTVSKVCSCDWPKSASSSCFFIPAISISSPPSILSALFRASSESSALFRALADSDGGAGVAGVTGIGGGAAGLPNPNTLGETGGGSWF